MIKYPETYLHITRLNGRGEKEKQTLGEGVAFINGWEKFRFKTMELPWKNNERKVSCIPAGTYQVVRRVSTKYKLHFHILDVPERDWILIHPANYSRQLMGCIAPGKKFLDIDGDGLKDVTDSVATLKELLEIMPETFPLYIEDAISYISDLDPKTDKRT